MDRHRVSELSGSPVLENDAPSAYVVRQAIAGNGDAQATLVRYFGPLVTAYLHGRVFNHQELEDLYQEIFLTAFSRLRTLRNPNRFAPWLLRIARSKWVDHVRRKKLKDAWFVEVISELDEYESGGAKVVSQRRPDVHGYATEIDEMVGACLGKLNDKHRVVVTLRLIEEMSINEIADRLSLKGSTVRMRLMRGLYYLRKMLHNKGLEFDYRPDSS